jgi:hypothetical protein
MGRLRGLFHRRGGCCESACDTCDSGGGGCGAAPAVAPTNTEQIPAPGNNKGGDQKKMPTGVEPPLKPVGLDAAPPVAPRVTVEAEKSPF